MVWVGGVIYDMFSAQNKIEAKLKLRKNRNGEKLIFLYLIRLNGISTNIFG